MTDTVRTSAGGREWDDFAFQGVWLLLGLVAVTDGVINLRNSSGLLPGAPGSYVITVAFGVLALGAAIADLAARKIWRLVGAVAGSVLGLYGLAMILLGHEDVGGLWVALPFGLASMGLGWWSIARFRRISKPRKAA